MSIFKKKQHHNEKLIIPLTLEMSLKQISDELSSYFKDYPDKLVSNESLVDDIISISKRVGDITHKDEPHIHLHGR